MSKDDEMLSMKLIGLLPVVDNLDGIYSVPIQKDIDAFFEKDLRWKSTPVPINLSLVDLEKSPTNTEKIMRSSQVDGLFASRLIKGPLGLQIKVVLFSGPLGWPLISEESPLITTFETAFVRSEFSKVFNRVIAKLPYQGVVTSRRGLDVTVNMGTWQGLQNGTDVSVIQILKVNRHPKLKFMVSSEKEIMGKIRIIKADEQTSFGQILFEKEKGVIEVGQKIAPDQYIQYPAPQTNGSASPDLQERKEAPLAFGKDAHEWVPEEPPQYGKFGVMAGLGPYSQKVSFTGSSTENAKSDYAPSITIQAEGWLNTDWFLGFELRQSVFSVSNTLSSSTPGRLNISTNRMDLFAGRNFLLSPDFYGPRLLISLGYTQEKSRVDESTPVLISNTSYSGMRLGFDFDTSLANDLPWEVGGRFRYFLWPTMSESVSSGSVDSLTMNEFTFKLAYRARQKLRYIGEAAFFYENSDFKNVGDRGVPIGNISQNSTVLSFGLQYLF